MHLRVNATQVQRHLPNQGTKGVKPEFQKTQGASDAVHRSMAETALSVHTDTADTHSRIVIVVGQTD